jgi:hypothetical protein
MIKAQKRLVILDAVGYEKRLRLIPAWGQATAKQIRESQEALAEIEVKSAGAEAKADPSIKRFVDLVVECRHEDINYTYDLFLRKHVNDLLERKDFNPLVRDGLSGDLKKDFGARIGIKVYGVNLERDKKIISKLASVDDSSKVLGNYIKKNKRSFIERYMREIDNQIYNEDLDDNYFLSLAKENVGEISCEELIDHFFDHASQAMRKSLLSVVFDYEMDYIKTIIKDRTTCKRVLIEYLVRSTALD